jgi:hypothetical protein
MGSEQAAFDYLMRLVSILKERAITCIMTNQITGLAGSDEELSGIGFSSVVDAVIQLRFVESGHEITRQILVIKSRGSAHSNRREPFVITSRGIEFPDNAPPSDPGDEADRNGGGLRKSPQPKSLQSNGRPGITCCACSWRQAERIPRQALANLRQLCQEHLKGRYTIEAIDVVKNFEAAVRNNILVTPALILVPAPARGHPGQSERSGRFACAAAERKVTHERRQEQADLSGWKSAWPCWSRSSRP